MSLKKILNIVVLCVSTIFIMNSLLFSFIITNFEQIYRHLEWDTIKYIFESLVAIIYNMFHPWSIYDVMFNLLILIYIFVILLHPVLLWWRKQTIIRACILAVTGSLLPPYIYLFLVTNPYYICISFVVMIAAYAMAYLISQVWRIYRNRCMGSISPS